MEGKNTGFLQAKLATSGYNLTTEPFAPFLPSGSTMRPLNAAFAATSTKLTRKKENMPNKSNNQSKKTNHRISEETRAKLSQAGKLGAQVRWGDNKDNR